MLKVEGSATRAPQFHLPTFEGKSRRIKVYAWSWMVVLMYKHDDQIWTTLMTVAKAREYLSKARLALYDTLDQLQTKGENGLE